MVWVQNPAIVGTLGQESVDECPPPDEWFEVKVTRER